MTRDRALKIRKILQRAIQKLDDDDAIEIVEFFDTWRPGEEYPLTCKVREGDRLYKVMQAHVAREGMEPCNTPALYQEIVSFNDVPVVQKWEAGASYPKGANVIYEGTVRMSTIDDNMYRPDDPRGWITVL